MPDGYEISSSDSNQDIAESVLWAAEEGVPLTVTLDNGNTVSLVPTTDTKTT